MKTSFETETCSRCNGSGQYSYCSDYGTTCFKCRGQKLVLTKRGAIARAYFVALCTKPVNALKIGDIVSTFSITLGGRPFNYIATITAIEPANPSTMGKTENGVTTVKTYQGLCLTLNSAKYGLSSCIVYENHTFRVYAPDDKAKLAESLTYQDSLTKQGKIRKKTKVLSRSAE